MLLKPQRLVKQAGLRYSRVYKIGSPIIVLLSALIASLSHSVEANEVRKPFRVLWNIPDNACAGRYYKTLINSGVEANKPGQFVGDTIATLYEPGLWPVIQGGKRINGGIPQLANLTAHLEALRKVVVRSISKNATGYGVIDFELWRVPFELNINEYTPYRWASVNWFQPKKWWSEAKKEWETSAGEMMLKSLETAKEARPNVLWGYYLYPRTWWYTANSIRYNDRDSPIYRASTGFYPSIYIKVPTKTVDDIHTRILNTLTEAIRVRYVHSHQDVPIIAYSWFNAGELRLFNQSLLDLAIRFPAEMGMDGVVLWGSNIMFVPDRTASCKIIGKYVEETLGPYISNLLKELNSCSQIKCSGNGKCVKTEYAKKVAYIRRTCTSQKKSTHGKIEVSDDDTDKTKEGDPQKTFANYECQCYCGYRGTFCDNSIDN